MNSTQFQATDFAPGSLRAVIQAMWDMHVKAGHDPEKELNKFKNKFIGQAAIKIGSSPSEVKRYFEQIVHEILKEVDKMNLITRLYNDGKCTEEIKKEKDGNYTWIGVNNRDNRQIFCREYEKGYPLMEAQLNPVEIELSESDQPSPVYKNYGGGGFCQRNGIGVNLENDGFFKVHFGENDPFPRDKFHVTDDGAWPLKTSNGKYCQSFQDWEPHNYRADSELNVKTETYHIKYYRDEDYTHSGTGPMTRIFSGNPRVTDKRVLKLFYLLEKNADLMKKNTIVTTKQGLGGCVSWQMADGAEVEAVPCPCSGTGHNGTTKAFNFYRNELFFDGISIYKVCRVCGTNEKLV